MKLKTLLISIPVIIAVCTAIFGVWLYVASYPKFDIQMYHTGKDLISTKNIPIIIETVDSQGVGTKICFQVKNSADKNSNTDVNANNVFASIQTDTECKECNVNVGIGTLEAQQSVQICKWVKSPTGAEQIYFKVIPTYDALMFHWNPMTEFTCKLTKTEQMQNYRTCDITHKDILGMEIFGIVRIP